MRVAMLKLLSYMDAIAESVASAVDVVTEFTQHAQSAAEAQNETRRAIAELSDEINDMRSLLGNYVRDTAKARAELERHVKLHHG